MLSAESKKLEAVPEARGDIREALRESLSCYGYGLRGRGYRSALSRAFRNLSRNGVDRAFDADLSLTSDPVALLVKGDAMRSTVFTEGDDTTFTLDSGYTDVTDDRVYSLGGLFAVRSYRKALENGADPDAVIRRAERLKAAADATEEMGALRKRQEAAKNSGLYVASHRMACVADVKRVSNYLIRDAEKSKAGGAVEPVPEGRWFPSSWKL